MQGQHQTPIVEFLHSDISLRPNKPQIHQEILGVRISHLVLRRPKSRRQLNCVALKELWNRFIYHPSSINNNIMQYIHIYI